MVVAIDIIAGQLVLGKQEGKEPNESPPASVIKKEIDKYISYYTAQAFIPFGSSLIFHTITEMVINLALHKP